MNQYQRDQRAKRSKEFHSLEFDLNALPISNTPSYGYERQLKEDGKLWGVFIDGASRGWHNIFIGSEEKAKEQFDCRQSSNESCALVNQTGIGMLYVSCTKLRKEKA